MPGGYETEFIYEMDGVKGIWIEIKGKERDEMAELNIDTFGEIMDDFIEKNHIQMLIDIPEGTNEPQIKDNAQLGGVVQFYILLTAMKPIYKDGERKTFIEAWGYHIQGYVYQQLEYQRTGEMKPFYLAVITKEDPADHHIIEVPQPILNSVAGIVEHYTPIFEAMKRGEVEPERCGACAYCRSTKKIEKPMSYYDLVDAL